MSILNLVDTEQTLEEVAADWFFKMEDPGCPEEQVQEFEAWIAADKSHEDAYHRVARTLSFVDEQKNDPLLEDLINSTFEETDNKASQVSLVKRAFMGITAAAACFAFVFFANPMMFSGDPATGVYETATGERSTVGLDDGTTVILNTNSKIEVQYNAHERRVSLIAGQAYFRVAKNKHKPFVVSADSQIITALGTAFDVRIDHAATAVNVVLVEGRVMVDELTNPKNKKSDDIVLDSRVELAAGERLIASPTVPRTPEKINAVDAVSWSTGSLVFRETDLVEAVAEINRYSEDQIRLADDERLAVIKVSGVFKTGATQTFLSVLESTYGLESQRTGKKEITVFWNEK